MKFNIVGAGRLGRTLAKLLYNIGHEPGCIVNQSQSSALSAQAFIGAGCAVANIDDISTDNVEYTLITVPDESIASTFECLTKARKIPKNSIVLHCSGALSSQILSTKEANDFFIASVHPIRSFANPNLSVNSFSGTFCAIEGDSEASEQLYKLFESIGGKPFYINQSKKPLYHASSVIASNYLVALLDASVKSYIESGIEPEVAHEIAHSLMNGTLQNTAASHCAKDSLTGPLARGDVAIIQKHLSALPHNDILSLYQMMGSYTVNALTDHSQEKKEALLKALKN